MSFALECKKVKRTGFAPALIGGGIAAAAVPALNMAFRWEMYIHMDATPVNILLNANWQMMAMLNVLLIIVGGCILYHIEYGDNAIQRMCTLPIKESSLFFGKSALTVALSILFLLVEAASVTVCAVHWFPSGQEIYKEILQNFGFSLLLLLPSILLSLLICAVCKNMWVSLGIGVICVLMATMIPRGNFALTLFPFALPFRTLAGLTKESIRNYAIASSAETLVISVLAGIILKVRRAFAC